MLFQLVVSVVLIVMVVRFTFTKIGAWWLRRILIALLFTMLFRRVDSMGGFVGVDPIPPFFEDVITVGALLLIIVAFESAHIRRRYLERAEQQRQRELHQKYDPVIEDLETRRRRSEQGISWDASDYGIRTF